MEQYIVCEKRGNHARIHVNICIHRCEHSDTCEAFQDYMNAQAASASEAVATPAPIGQAPEEGIPATVP